MAIHAGQYSAKDYNKLKPFGKAKVKQLREEAKKKEKKSEARSVAAVTTQEDDAQPEVGNATVTSVPSNAGQQFGRAAHSEQKKSA